MIFTVIFKRTFEDDTARKNSIDEIDDGDHYTIDQSRWDVRYFT